ncbi:MAG: Motility protein B [Holosporales bacterium]
MKDDKKVIKKIFKKAAHGHHGGAWKIAYADFVTAMMAFFLLMWLINSISIEQKKGIADYFTPNVSKLKSKPSGEGALAGKNMDGQALTDMTGSVTDEENNTENQKKFNSNSDKLNNEDNTGGKRSDLGESKEMDKAEEPEEEKQKIKALIETQEQIKKALEASVALKTLANQVLFEMTPEGMNINIVDKDNRSMFPPGNFEMYDYMRNVLTEIAGTIREKPNKIGISGHTGSAQFSDTKNYSNWELSADRANASRRVLESAGIVSERIEYVKGREGKDPLKKENPDAPENRRITITLLK